MKHLTLFETNEEYVTWKEGNIEYPNVTYVREDMEVYYNDGR